MTIVPIAKVCRSVRVSQLRTRAGYSTEWFASVAHSKVATCARHRCLGGLVCISCAWPSQHVLSLMSVAKRSDVNVDATTTTTTTTTRTSIVIGLTLLVPVVVNVLCRFAVSS